MERKIELVLTSTLKGFIDKKFQEDPNQRIKIYESLTMNPQKSVTDEPQRYILGELDSNYVFYTSLCNEESLEVIDLPTVYLDGVFGKSNGKIEVLSAVHQCTGFYASKLVNESNPLIRLQAEIRPKYKEKIACEYSELVIPYFKESIKAVDVKVINISDNPLPKYETAGAAGMDVLANIKECVTLKPGERKLIPSGIKVELPGGWALDVRPKSGLALKKGVTVLNTPGLIDEDYRGEIGVILINHGNEDFTVNPSDKIAQLTLAKVNKISWTMVDELGDTERGEGGYGSTGK